MIVALDLSLTGTGVCAGGETDVIRTVGLDSHPRLERILTGVQDWTGHPDIVLVAIEGYAHGRHNRAHQIGELGGLVRHHLWRRHIPYIDVPPATLKKYATGRGNATKPDMRMALYQRTGIDQPDDNQVDAWWLWALASDLTGSPAVQLPAGHRAALDRLTLPEQCGDAA